MPILIRDAADSDLTGILPIYNDAVRNSTAIYSEQEANLEHLRNWLAAKQAQGYPLLVADGGEGAVLGYATFGDFRVWPGYRHTVEHSVYVRGDARRQGIASALMGPLMVRAQGLGKHVMVAAVDARNQASIRLHQRLGFEQVGLLREVGTKFGVWLDLVFMQRILGTTEGST